MYTDYIAKYKTLKTQYDCDNSIKVPVHVHRKRKVIVRNMTIETVSIAKDTLDKLTAQVPLIIPCDTFDLIYSTISIDDYQINSFIVLPRIPASFINNFQVVLNLVDFAKLTYKLVEMLSSEELKKKRLTEIQQLRNNTPVKTKIVKSKQHVNDHIRVSTSTGRKNREKRRRTEKPGFYCELSDEDQDEDGEENGRKVISIPVPILSEEEKEYLYYRDEVILHVLFSKYMPDVSYEGNYFDDEDEDEDEGEEGE